MMIQKLNLRDQVTTYLLEEIKRGAITPNSAISLAQLSRALEISVTPVREALNQLSRSGFIEAIPNRGFRVRPLQIKEATEIYPLISTLENLAVKHAQYDAEAIELLKLSNEKFQASVSLREAVLADKDFHQQLIKPYENNTLESLISDLKLRVLIYEFEFQDDHNLFLQSAREHLEIIRALETQNKIKARELLNAHWERSLYFISKKMSQ